MHDGLGYDWSYIAQDEPTEFALMAYTLNSSTQSKANLEIVAYQLGLESVEAQLVIHQKNEVVYEEKIAILEFEVKDKGLQQIRLVLVSLHLANTSVEMPRVESVRPSGVIIEDWVSDDDEDIFQSNDSQTIVKPSFKKIEFTKARNEHTSVSKEKVNTVRVNGVNTVGQTVVSTVKGNGVTAVKASNVVPSGDLTCLFAKATIDESKLWHRRLGHVNFKTMNKLVKGNLVRGLPSKTFENDHTCVACQKGKQHKASCKTKHVSSISQPLQMLHMDLFGPTSVRSINHKTYCLVVTDDFSSYKSLDDKTEDDTVDDVAGKKNVQEPASEYDQALKNVLDKMMDQEKEATEQSDAVRKEFEAQCNSQEKITRASSTNIFNIVSTPVNTASASRTFSHVGPSSGPSFVPFSGSFPIDVVNLPHDPLMHELEDTTEI
ncbi:putative ribonuclease H-like domain-containing protein [Tanacetum coccineum]